MRSFWRAWVAEWRHLLRSPADLALLTLFPLATIAIVASIFVGGVARQLPVAVIDQDGSAFSRELASALAASPTLDVAITTPDAAAALKALRGGRVVAALQIPPGAAQGLARAQSPVLTVYYNASFLSVGKLAESAIEGAVTAMAAPALLAHELNAVLPAVRRTLPTVQTSVLFNPQAAFEGYLEAMVQPAVLHLVVACATVMALGRELRRGSLRGWARRQRNLPMALAGKMGPAVLLMGFWGAVWLIWLAGVRDWRPQGSIALAWLGQVLLFMATAAISALLVAGAKRVGTALSLTAIYAGSALAFSGGTLPLNGASWLAVGWSAVLPYPHYLALAMDQALGSPPALALRPGAVLLGYVLIAGGVACALMALARRPQPRPAPNTHEAAHAAP